MAILLGWRGNSNVEAPEEPIIRPRDSIDQNRIAVFSTSLARCLADPAFITRFYDLFVDTSPEAAEKFRNTNFERQRRAMGTSLYVIVLALEQGEAAMSYLDRVARQHGRNELDIRPELYDAWLRCLIQSVEEYDPLFSEDVETVWREAMQFGIQYMRERY